VLSVAASHRAWVPTILPMALSPVIVAGARCAAPILPRALAGRRGLGSRPGTGSAWSRRGHDPLRRPNPRRPCAAPPRAGSSPRARPDLAAPDRHGVLHRPWGHGPHRRSPRCGKTALPNLVARNAQLDVVVVVACGKRMGEVVATIPSSHRRRIPDRRLTGREVPPRRGRRVEGSSPAASPVVEASGCRTLRGSAVGRRRRRSHGCTRRPRPERSPPGTPDWLPTRRRAIAGPIDPSVWPPISRRTQWEEPSWPRSSARRWSTTS
jgi:hypothetical protein